MVAGVHDAWRYGSSICCRHRKCFSTDSSHHVFRQGKRGTTSMIVYDCMYDKEISGYVHIYLGDSPLVCAVYVTMRLTRCMIWVMSGAKLQCDKRVL
jgi:hypothetical protein